MHTPLPSVSLTLKQATPDPCLHRRLQDTHRQVWVSSLWGSLLLSPGFWCLQSFVSALQESVSPGLCKFWWFCGGVNGDLFQEGLCHTQVCTQSPCGRPLLTRTSSGDTQTQFWLGLSELGMPFAPFPGLSSSGDQVLRKHTVPGGPCVLITSLVLATRLWSQVCCKSLES